MNLGSFSPKTLNEVFDKLCALIQQVRLLADRALVVPFTQDKTPEEVLTEVLEIAATANEYAQQAALVYQQVIQLRDELNALVPTLKAALESEADDRIEEIAQFAQGQIAAILDSTNALLAEQLDRINSAANSALTLNRLLCSEAVKTFNVDTASGTTITLPSGIRYVVGLNHLALESEADDRIEEIAQFAQGQIAAILDSTNALLAEQLDRINSAANSALTLNRLLCSEAVKTFNVDTASGTTITLPSGIRYVVGLNHLRLSLNGTILYPEQQYEEVGQTSHLSTQVKLLFPVKANDRFEVWVIPLGGTVDEETGEVTPEAGFGSSRSAARLTRRQGK